MKIGVTCPRARAVCCWSNGRDSPSVSTIATRCLAVGREEALRAERTERAQVRGRDGVRRRRRLADRDRPVHGLLEGGGVGDGHQVRQHVVGQGGDARGHVDEALAQPDRIGPRARDPPRRRRRPRGEHRARHVDHEERLAVGAYLDRRRRAEHRLRCGEAEEAEDGGDEERPHPAPGGRRSAQAEQLPRPALAPCGERERRERNDGRQREQGAPRA